MAARGFIGAGDIYIARYTLAGVPGPLVYAGDGNRFQLKANSTLKERKSRGRNTNGQVVESIGIPEPADLAITLSEPTQENLALALMASVTSTTRLATPVADEPVTARLGEFVPLTRQHINPVGVTVTSTGGTPTTYAEGTDYVVNQPAGLIKALDGGAIAQDEPLLVSYTPIAGGESVVTGGVVSSLRAEILFDGINTADDSPVICRVWEAVLLPTEPVDLLRDDWLEIGLEGRMKTPAGRAGPFEMRFFTAA